MRAHWLQHVAFEGLGSIEAWLEKENYEISVTRLYEFSEFPQLENIDLLIIMGGPMSVNDTDVYPWLFDEIKWIREAIDQRIPILGVCLGAQLIARSMGEKVYANDEKEIGWFPVHGLEGRQTPRFLFANSPECFHWHGETFDLPHGAELLASSDGCRHQAFLLGEKVMGLQFHLETTAEGAQGIVEHCNEELVDGLYIQTKAEILSAPPVQYEKINGMMKKVLSYLTS